jgi:adenylate cyclase
MSEVFISYARSTEAQAKRIAEALRGLGYGVWRDDELPAHRSYAEVIEERLKAAKAVVVVWSAEAARSEWVQSEADRARTDRKLVQVTVDGAALPMPFDRIQCADLTGWDGEPESPGWKKVADSIATLARGVAPAAESSRPAAAAAPAAGVSVCVLPFANMSGDAEQEYFSDGISEDIITDLSKVSALAVTARNSAFAFKGKSIDVRQVAREVGASHVLEGSVRKSGARVRITAQLIDGATNNHVWAERYDRELDDIFALQDEISQAIVKALRLRLLPEEKRAIERRGTTSADAYNHYLMARQYYLYGNRGDPRREEAIVRMCSRAVEIDPDYARAWALMAFAQYSLRYSRGRSGDDGLAAADRAISLDPALAEPHAAKARILVSLRQGDQALVELKLALSLDPESPEVLQAAGYLNYVDQNYQEAIRYFSKAAALDEADFTPTAMLVSSCKALGDTDGARRAAEMSLARAEKVLARDQSNGYAMAFGAGALAVLGEKDRFRQWIDRALLVDPDNLLMRYNFACALSSDFHDADGALELLAQVFENPITNLLKAAPTDPDLDPIRDDPRFVALLAHAQARIANEATSGTAA